MDASNHHYNQFQVFRYQLNKLQTYKSSFQAWKCASFGYALLASVLLFSKWHEVSTDLRLLQSVEQLLWLNSNSSSSGSSGSASLHDHLLMLNNPNATGGSAQPVALALQSSSASSSSADDDDNSTTTLVDGAASTGPELPPASQRNTSHALMSHMQISLSREATGNQVLKQEVETFLGSYHHHHHHHYLICQ